MKIMPQLSISISKEDLDFLNEAAQENSLRPLTLASAFLSQAIRGQRTAEAEWKKFKSNLDTDRIRTGKGIPLMLKADLIEKEFGSPKGYSKDPKDIEERHGDEADIDEQLRKLAPRVDITKGRGTS